ncbi:hypothetical protein L226DRAFT_534756 [Lentinus tigrinus ALCF2SS1-7]|uniref:CNH domain-containing protein n=1 Tax=Lentinus tigrinus ALCF2SS1-6 TaxID=1328759 RepID=A0A5C2SCV6_9APHY|nr:hypothetical protein L227DRAFT_574732 [Lentinus tigrinus ALCF2SS1-6]RPD75178.1 hypothetical protein L226DRAFT_534756 [Lentinus tigrinus ALCF2SS1-7]
MGPFNAPEIVLDGFKERPEALAVQGDKLFIGTATGNLHVYTFGEAGEQQGQLVETKKALCRKGIEQIAFIKDVNSLVVLSEAQLTLFPYPSFSPPTPLVKAKGALCFALHTVVEYLDVEASAPATPGTPGSKGKGVGKGVPALVTRLAVGCRRKIVLYSWKDGEPQDVQEVAGLAHSPRAITFVDGQTLCWGHTPTDYCLTSVKTSVTVDVTTPIPTTSSTNSIGMGMGALSGLGGYMTLGLGAKAKPNVINVNENEALVAKDNNGFLVGPDGKTARPESIDWPAPPDEIASVKPYVFAILPPGSVPTTHVEGVPGASASTFIPSPVIEIRSSISLSPVQTIPFPPSPPTSLPSTATHTLRLLTPSPSAKSPLFVVSTPTDRTAATNAGSAVWCFRIKPWNQQIDELVEAGAYSDARSLLDSLDAALIADKERKQKQIRALQAVDQFRNAKYDDAINAFIELDINPAKVVALYPESIAGRLSVPQDEWIPLYGGPRPPKAEPPPTSPNASTSDVTVKAEEQGGPRSVESPPRPSTPQGSIRNVLLRTGLESLMSTAQDDDAASIRSVRRPPRPDNFQRSIETLMRYLSDRRPKIAGALTAFHITPMQSHEMPHLSATSKEDLLNLPNAPLSSLSPEELVRFAQIVDTALFKSYLLVRPGLLAPLCRVGWCEVSEVEELLRDREKYQEMIYLYHSRKMHGKALDLLRQLSEKETDPHDKLMPTVNYLQRLGPEHLEQIFEYSRWVFEQDRDIAFEIFTSEEAELPKDPVADFLERLDPAICARYIEFLIAERGETSQHFHDRLAELYLHMTINAKRRGDDGARRTAYEKLLQFVDTTGHYSADRLFALLPPEDLFEAKAILLGRLGRHDSALEVYVYRLQDYFKAEEYCKRVYQPNSPTSNVFLTLLRIYLLPGPSAPAAADLLPPALELISRHSPRLDPVATLQLLPPLVTAQDVRAFLLESLRAPVFDTRVVRSIHKAREDQVARRLMVLQSKRVRITESRICPQCHKRLGGSVIAVHAPHGEVTHYQCREAFSRKLREIRT